MEVFAYFEALPTARIDPKGPCISRVDAGVITGVISAEEAIEFLGGVAAGAILAKKLGDNAGAVVDLAKGAARRGGLTCADAETLIEWADEYDVHNHGPEPYEDRPFNKPHIHVGPVSHIPVN